MLAGIKDIGEEFAMFTITLSWKFFRYFFVQ
jgi:hypothetical protein